MKRIYLLFLLISFIVNAASSQTIMFDENQNAYIKNAVQPAGQRNDVDASTSSVDIDCGAGGKFWTVTTPTGSILEWQLSGTTITFLDTLFITSPVTSLSYCNLLNAGSIASTLYGSEITTMSYYNGNAWVTITPSQQYSNSGGCGRFLYFMRSGATALDRYNGNTFTNAVTLQNAQFGVADIAVDTGGKIWAFASKVAIGDTLIAFDSVGNVVKRYNISPPIDENNAYGCFLMDSTLYIGVGNANTTYPNTVIPIRIYADTAIEGSPISFVNGSFVDMASCSNPLITDAYNYASDNGITLFPNPATDQLTVRISQDGWQTATISIMNVLGQMTSPKESGVLRTPPAPLLEERGEATIDVSQLSAGIYFIRLTSEKESWVGKFVKN